MNIFFTQLRRRIAVFGLLAVLLAAVVAFQSIAVSSLAAVRAQTAAVSGQYATIAVPIAGSTWTRVLYEDESTERTSLMRQSMKYPGLLSEDRRALLKAHVTGCESVSAYEKDYFSNDTYDMFNRAFAVLAVRCTDVREDVLTWSKANYDENGELIDFFDYPVRGFGAEFTPEETVSLFPAYDGIFPPMETISSGGVYPTDGKLPFEVGKTYLLFGCIFPSQKIISDYDENGDYIYDFAFPGRYSLNICEQAMNGGTSDDLDQRWDMLHSWTMVEGEDGIFYQRMDEGTLPYCAEYTGTVEEFLNSADGAIWRDTILPLCKTNYESAEVILTDNLESMLRFNTGDASVFEGRSFEPQEYADGENVCLVSAAYAAKNNLSVGQTLELDLYGSSVRTQNMLVGDFSLSEVNCNVYEPCKEENRLGIKKEFKIVGIYSAPEFGTGEQNFNANTIFLPKASVPNAERYENIEHSLLYSLILENGKADEFEAALKERDCGGLFAYFDQDYNVLAETLDVMEGNAVRMVLISSALFVLVTALFFFLFLRQTADPARKLRLLGVRAGAVRRQRYGAAVVLIVAAAVLGAAGGAGLYGAVTKRVLSGNIALQPTALLLAVAIQTILLLLAALLCTLATARQNLVQKK